MTFISSLSFCTSRSKVNVSIALKFYRELSSHGADDVLRRVYGKRLLPKADEGYDVTVQVREKLSNSRIAVRTIYLRTRYRYIIVCTTR